LNQGEMDRGKVIIRKSTSKKRVRKDYPFFVKKMTQRKGQPVNIVRGGKKHRKNSEGGQTKIKGGGKKQNERMDRSGEG